MRQIELSPVEYKALMAFADGASIARPVRRRLLQAHALVCEITVDGKQIFKLTPSAEASLIENAPRCKWTPEDARRRTGTQAEQTEAYKSIAGRRISMLAVAGAIALAGGR